MTQTWYRTQTDPLPQGRTQETGTKLPVGAYLFAHRGLLAPLTTLPTYQPTPDTEYSTLPFYPNTSSTPTTQHSHPLLPSFTSLPPQNLQPRFPYLPYPLPTPSHLALPAVMGRFSMDKQELGFM
jgi:hypothetical protein